MGQKVVVSNAKLLKDIETGQVYMQCGCGGSLVPLEGGGGTGTSGVSSWNDLTDKPFGEVVELVTLFENDTAEFNSMSRDDITYGFYSANGVYHTSFSTDGKIIVIYDGVEYQCVPVMSENGWALHFGNGDLAPFDEVLANQPNLPFYVISNEMATMIYNETGGTHSISIRNEKAISKPIDEKYIPESIAKSEDLVDYVKLVKCNMLECYIYAGETTFTGVPSCNIENVTVDECPSVIVDAYCEYTKEDGSRHRVPLDWSINIIEQNYTLPSGGLYTGVQLTLNLSLKEALETGAKITLYSNYPFAYYSM